MVFFCSLGRSFEIRRCCRISRKRFLQSSEKHVQNVSRSPWLHTLFKFWSMSCVLKFCVEFSLSIRLGRCDQFVIFNILTRPVHDHPDRIFAILWFERVPRGRISQIECPHLFSRWSGSTGKTKRTGIFIINITHLPGEGQPFLGRRWCSYMEMTVLGGTKIRWVFRKPAGFRCRDRIPVEAASVWGHQSCKLGVKRLC